jgi:phosphoribosylanthranilate isomerase
LDKSRVRIKMCGMTRYEDVQHAATLGADAIGFIFYDKSPRHIRVDQAKAIVEHGLGNLDLVAVVVNPSLDFMHQLLAEIPVSLLQFHGDESPEFCAQFHVPFIKSVHPLSAQHIQQEANRFKEARALLFDTASTAARGGTGQTFDWQIIPEKLTIPYLVAGGLNPDNVSQAIRSCTPYAVDVCSGIEISPGIKDHQKMHRFIQAVWGKE